VTRLAAAVVLLSVGAGLGTYFTLSRGSSASKVPKAEQSAILEEARDRRVIPDYRVLTFDRRTGYREYQVLGGEIRLRFAGVCGAMACPSSVGLPWLFIEYRHTASAAADGIRSIAP
jgi:hypothetical protein